MAQRPGAVALLDDGLARRMAQHLGVPFSGTLGVLLRAKAAGHIAAVAPIVDRLEALGFRLDAMTRAGILELAIGRATAPARRQASSGPHAATDTRSRRRPSPWKGRSAHGRPP